MDKPQRILVLNGPNLNMLGEREIEIYGSKNLLQIEEELKEYARQQGYDLVCKQSNSEGDLIDWIQNSRSEGFAGLIINPGAYTHYSIAILDALKGLEIPVIEVHISNILQREYFRQNMITTKGADAVMAGFGPRVYLMALSCLIDLLNEGGNGDWKKGLNR